MTTITTQNLSRAGLVDTRASGTPTRPAQEALSPSQAARAASERESQQPPESDDDKTVARDEVVDESYSPQSLGKDRPSSKGAPRRVSRYA